MKTVSFSPPLISIVNKGPTKLGDEYDGNKEGAAAPVFILFLFVQQCESGQERGTKHGLLF